MARRRRTLLYVPFGTRKASRQPRSIKELRHADERVAGQDGGEETRSATPT